MVHVPGDYPTIQAALDALAGDGVVEITNCDRYSAASIHVNVNPNGRVELRAHDGFRPVLVLDGEFVVTGEADSVFDLNGLLVTSSIAPANPTPAALIRIPATLSGGDPNQLSSIALTNCTLVPGWALTPGR